MNDRHEGGEVVRSPIGCWMLIAGPARTWMLSPMPYTYADLAGMIDHALLHPTLTDAEVRAGCELARSYAVASACVRPCDVALAVECLAGSAVAVGTVIGFPHGSSATEIKRFETAQACRDGAEEIDVVINIGKALGGDWGYVETELRAVAEESHGHGALLKVIFETDFLTDDAAKIRLCEICDGVGADFVKTSTGFGFVRQPDGRFHSTGATAHDVALMRAHTSSRVRIKASGGIRNLDELIAMRELGASRCGTSSTAKILDEFRRRESLDKIGHTPASDVESGVGSY
jgi:deoxyribose-phosphate aldolase